MEGKVTNNSLEIVFDTRLDTNNVSEVSDEINSILESNTFKSLILNFKQLTYVSSAGLRVILGLRKIYKDFKIIEVNDVVYDILEMTGFTDIMDIAKKED